MYFARPRIAPTLVATSDVAWFHQPS